MADQPQRAGMPTAVKVLLILGLLFLLFIGGFVGVCAYCVAANPELRQMGKLMGESVRMSIAATKAPGTRELREAGCAQAMVMDMRRIAELVKEIDESEHGSAEQAEDLGTVMVVCQVSSSEDALSCEDVARTYGAAVENPPAEFAAVVQTRFPQEAVCEGVYGPDGTRLGDLEQETAPPDGESGPKWPPAEEGEPLFPDETPPAEQPPDEAD
jgi:hypothetical protein